MDISDQISEKPILTNDQRAWVGFEVNGQMLQAQRLAVRDSLTIVGLVAGKVYELDMTNHLGHNLLVTGLTADITEDDGKALQPSNSTNYRYATVQLIIQLLDRTNKAVKREIVLFISSYSNLQNELVLSATGLYRIKVNQTVNDISILGVPVVVSNPQIAYNLPTIEAETSSADDT